MIAAPFSETDSNTNGKAVFALIPPPDIYFGVGKMAKHNRIKES
jgi:hypothetical protein